MNLPADILTIICSYQDIDTIKNFYLTDNYLEKILDDNFWRSYFQSHNILITIQQNNILNWVNEFKTNEILMLASHFRSEICQNIMLLEIVHHPGIRCSNPTIPNSNF